jgi:putative inorganic carbon (hco3(-)) transporter
MNTLWQNLMLSSLSLPQWRGASYLYQLIGPLRAWRKGSWLMQWADQLGFLLVSLVFGLAPFVPNALTGLLLTACAAYWVLLTLSDDTDQPGFTPIHLVITLFWGITTVATAMSPVKMAAFVGWQKFTLYVLFFALMARILRSPRLRSWLIGVYLHVSLIVSVEGIRQKIFGAAALATWVDPESPTSKSVRVYSFLGNPNLLAGYLLPAVVFSMMAIFAWKGRIPKLLAIVMAGLNLACLVWTDSRGGFIGIMFAIFTLSMLLLDRYRQYFPGRWRQWAIPAILGGLACALIVGIAVVEPLRDRVFSIFAGRQDSSNNYRMNVWEGAARMIQARPVLGIGPGNVAFNRIYPLFQNPRYSALSAYSIPLEIAVESGIIGLSCFVWLATILLNQGFSRLQQLRQTKDQNAFWLMGTVATIIGMLGHGLVDTVWYRPEVSTLWWLMVALIVSFYGTPLNSRHARSELS